MRIVVTGLNAEGRSCIAEDVDVPPVFGDGVVGTSSGTLWTTTVSPSATAPPQLGSLIGGSPAPGELRWAFADMEPGIGVDHGLHHHLDLKLVIIVEGSTRLVVEEGETVVEAGQCFVLHPVNHLTEAGPNGCRMVYTAIGVNPPD